MVESSGLLPYDPRATTSAPLQRSTVAPHYMMGSMGTSYNMAAMPNMPAPQYQGHNPFSYQTYTPPSPPQMVVPYRQQYQENRPSLRVSPPGNDRTTQDLTYSREDRSMYGNDQTNSPLIKSETHMSAQQPRTTRQSAAASGTITPDSEHNEGNRYEGTTEIDVLMKEIQSKVADISDVDMAESRYQSPPEDTKREEESRFSSPEASQSSGKGSRKRYPCDYRRCRQKFSQKTHLEIHLRSHTGVKPYKCPFEQCGTFFSQKGNLTSHERRHTGEKPFGCPFPGCEKRFSQRGNLMAHGAVHDPEKRFFCKLENCTKKFTQRGNLKSHQNRYHKSELARLTKKIADMSPEKIKAADDRELIEYFADIYKHANKGIKGRGTNRKVELLVPTNNHNNNNNNNIPNYPVQQHTPPMNHQVPQHHVPQLPHPGQHGLPLPSSPYLGQHALPPPSNFHHFAMLRNGSYNIMIDVNQEPMSSTTSSSSPGTNYEEDHTRGLAFGDRLY